MKKSFHLLPVFALALLTTITSCKKQSSTSTTDDPSTEIQAHSDDYTNISTGMDDVATDADAALEATTSFTGRSQKETGVCGASLSFDTTSSPRKITITYNGNNCANTYLRTGSVVLSMPATTRWKNAGAAVTVTFQNLKIKRLTDNKSITINGAQTITNVSGGLLLNLSSLQTITHTITSSNMSITFDDNTQRTWQVARKREFTYNNGVVLTISGIGVTGNVSNATEWGTNRFGHAFVTSITSPLIFRQDCAERLTAGEIKHDGFATATVKFGLNASGAPTTCPGTGNYFLKLTWTGPNGGSLSVIWPY